MMKHLRNQARIICSFALSFSLCIPAFATSDDLTDSTPGNSISNSSTSIAITVSGTVTSKGDGQPLPGVNVLVKGTATGTTTDSNGKYIHL